MIYDVFVSTERVITIDAPDEQSAIKFAWEDVGGEAFCDDPEITDVEMLGEHYDQLTVPEYRVAAQENAES